MEWAPSNSTNTSPLLLIVCDFGITAYSPETHSFLWKVAQNGISLFVNLFSAFVFDKKRGNLLKKFINKILVVEFNPESGEVLKINGFSSPHHTIVITGDPENICFIGLSQQVIFIIQIRLKFKKW